MNRKSRIGLIIGLLVLLVIAATAAWYIYVYQAPEEEPESQVMDPSQEHMTNEAVFFVSDVPPADPMMVGKWRNSGNQLWYKVYYDDYAEDGTYWGKEWDEKDDVYEEDLSYHGNGWFRWSLRNGKLEEYATMDSRDVPIAKEYKVRHLSADSLVYEEMRHGNRDFRFVRSEED